MCYLQVGEVQNDLEDDSRPMLQDMQHVHGITRDLTLSGMFGTKMDF